MPFVVSATEDDGEEAMTFTRKTLAEARQKAAELRSPGFENVRIRGEKGDETAEADDNVADE